MSHKQEFTITGNIRTTNNLSTRQTQELAQKLQTFMNEAGITKLDVCLDPFSKGPVKVSRTGIIMSTQN